MVLQLWPIETRHYKKSHKILLVHNENILIISEKKKFMIWVEN